MPKTALITGISGQDGSYLAEFLLSKGYEVHGMMRRTSTKFSACIEHLKGQFTIHDGDLTDSSSLIRVIEQCRPREVYNLGAQSFVPLSWEQPIFTTEVTGVGVARMLDAVLHVDQNIRFYQASSSEMFGRVRETPQRETTPFHPRSPYGAAKAFGHYITVNYRESYDMYACSGILFNHESPRRGLEFVTRKISNSVARIHAGLDTELRLGNLDAKRDWGHARDYVRAMWMMLQQDKPDDFVVGTGEMHSVREFVEAAFERVGLDWQDYVVVDPKLYRPAEVDQLLSDPTKARTKLGWQPTVTFKDLVHEMVDADLATLSVKKSDDARANAI